MDVVIVPEVAYVKRYPGTRLLLLADVKAVLIPLTQSDAAPVPEYMSTRMFLVVLTLEEAVLVVFMVVLTGVLELFNFVVADCEVCKF
jgi:hypothetical protein